MAGGSGLLLAAVGVASFPAAWLGVRFVSWETGCEGFALPASIVAGCLTIGLWAVLVTPANYVLAATLLLGWALLSLSAVDYLALRLPDLLTLPLIAIGLTLSWWLPDRQPLGHVAGAAVAFLLLYGVAAAYRHARGREGLGLGDAKLAAAAGAWLGWQSLPAMLLIACAAAFVWVGVAVATRGRAAMHENIPFGVPLCLAFWLVWLYGAPDFSGFA